jgi:hypothetical protein
MSSWYQQQMEAQMQLHVLHAPHGIEGWCKSGGWFWVATIETKKKIIRWKGPFGSREEVLRSWRTANPQAGV